MGGSEGFKQVFHFRAKLARSGECGATRAILATRQIELTAGRLRFLSSISNSEFFHAQVFIIFLFSIVGIYSERRWTERGDGKCGVKTFRLITASPVNIKYIPPTSDKYFMKPDGTCGDGGGGGETANNPIRQLVDKLNARRKGTSRVSLEIP